MYSTLLLFYERLYDLTEEQKHCCLTIKCKVRCGGWRNEQRAGVITKRTKLSPPSCSIYSTVRCRAACCFLSTPSLPICCFALPPHTNFFLYAKLGHQKKVRSIFPFYRKIIIINSFHNLLSYSVKMRRHFS